MPNLCKNYQFCQYCTCCSWDISAGCAALYGSQDYWASGVKDCSLILAAWLIKDHLDEKTTLFLRSFWNLSHHLLINPSPKTDPSLCIIFAWCVRLVNKGWRDCSLIWVAWLIKDHCDERIALFFKAILKPSQPINQPITEDWPLHCISSTWWVSGEPYSGAHPAEMSQLLHARQNLHWQKCVCVCVCMHTRSCCTHWILTICICKECVRA